MFKIHANKFFWLKESNEETDLCLHGDVITVIGDETFRYEETTVSSTALYLLKSLSQDHIIGKDNQMLPCCGFSIYCYDDSDDVFIVGCNNGIDWTIIHENEGVRLITESGKETKVDFYKYKKEVFKFADSVEAFYNSSLSKILPENEDDKDGYISFWNEYRRRRNLDYTSNAN